MDVQNAPLASGLPMAASKILVTGGTGFLGAYIIKELVEKGYKVMAIRRNNKIPFFIPSNIFENHSASHKGSVSWIDADIMDVFALAEIMENVDAVIHAAAKISFAHNERQQMFKVNIEGTANVVNIALEKNIRRFIHVSSVAALGRTKNAEVVTEEKKWSTSNLNTNYANSKYHAEMEVWRGIGEGLNAVIVNPSTILGYGDWNKSSCAIYKNVYNQFPWYTKGINGFVDVEDVAKATVILMESNFSNERFIINSENWSFEKLLGTIAKGFNKPAPKREATILLGEIAWRLEKVKAIFTGKKPLLTKESARVAHSKTYFDNKKILSALPGFSFKPLQEAIYGHCIQYLNLLNGK